MLRWTADDDNLMYETIQSRMDPEKSDRIKVEDNPILVPMAGEYDLMRGCFYQHEEPDLYFDDIEAALAPSYYGEGSAKSGPSSEQRDGTSESWEAKLVKSVELMLERMGTMSSWMRSMDEKVRVTVVAFVSPVYFICDTDNCQR